MSFLQRSRQKGVTLIEIAMVLVVGALLATGTMFLYGSVSSDRKVSMLESDINQLADNIRTLYSNVRVYAGLNESLVKTKSLYNPAYTLSGSGTGMPTSLENVFLYVAPGSSSVTNPNFLVGVSPIIFSGVCMAVANRVGSFGGLMQDIRVSKGATGTEGKLGSMFTGGTTVYDAGAKTVKMDALVKQCKQAAAAHPITLIFSSL